MAKNNSYIVKMKIKKQTTLQEIIENPQLMVGKFFIKKELTKENIHYHYIFFIYKVDKKYVYYYRITNNPIKEKIRFSKFPNFDTYIIVSNLENIL